MHFGIFIPFSIICKIIALICIIFFLCILNVIHSDWYWICQTRDSTKICTVCCYCWIKTMMEYQQTALLWESVGSQVTRLRAVWSGVQYSVWARYFSHLQSTCASFSVGASSPKERHPGCEADPWPPSDAEVQDDCNYISTPHPHPICLQWCEQGQICCYLHLQIKLFESLFNISLVTCRYRQTDMMKFVCVSLLLQHLFAPVPKTDTEGNVLVFSSGIYCVYPFIF